jgi:hypothetical protein
MRYVDRLGAWFFAKPYRIPLLMLVTAIILILLIGDD